MTECFLHWITTNHKWHNINHITMTKKNSNWEVLTWDLKFNVISTYNKYVRRCRTGLRSITRKQKNAFRLTSARSVGLVQKPGSNDQIWLISAMYVLYSTIRPLFSYSSPAHENQLRQFYHYYFRLIAIFQVNLGQLVLLLHQFWKRNSGV